MTSPGGGEGTTQVGTCPSSSSLDSRKEKVSDHYVSRPSLLSQRLLCLRTYRPHLLPSNRRKREMIPAEKKNNAYWKKRRKNNEAAKRSREKRRLNYLLLESQLLALSEENALLRSEILTLQYHFSMTRETPSPETSALSAALGHGPSPLRNPTPNLLPPALWAHWVNSSEASPLLGQQHLEHWLPDSSQSHRSAEQGSLGLPRLFTPSILSQRRVISALQSTKSSAEHWEARVHHQISSSYNLPTDDQDSACTPTVFHPNPQVSTLSPSTYSPQSWHKPNLGHFSGENNGLLLPWRAPCLPLSPLYPSLPLYLPVEGGEGQGRPAQGLDLAQGYWNCLTRGEAVVQRRAD